MPASNDEDCAGSDSSYCSPPPSDASNNTLATAPVSMLARGLAHATRTGWSAHPGRTRFAAPTAGRPNNALLRDSAVPGTGEGHRSGPAETRLAAGNRTATGPYGTPGYRCVSEALCFPVCYGDKLWSPCLRGPSDSKPLDKFTVGLGLSTF